MSLNDKNNFEKSEKKDKTNGNKGFPEEVINFTKIIDNIMEVDSEEIKPKRKKSFNCSNILKNKRKQKNDEKHKNIKDTNDGGKMNKYKLISLLDNTNDKKNIRREKSFNLKSGKKSEKSYKSSKCENYSLNNQNERRCNLSLSSFKTKKLRNFLPKSEILGVYNKNNLISTFGENKNNLDLLFTKRTKEQE